MPNSKDKYLNAAINNINWALTQQRRNGWYENNSFEDDSQPLVHTIAYAIRGILEAGILLQKAEFIASASVAAEALITRQLPNGALAWYV